TLRLAQADAARRGRAATTLPAPGHQEPAAGFGYFRAPATGHGADPGRGPAGAGVSQPARLRPLAALPRLRLAQPVPTLRRAHDPASAPQRATLPPLRACRAAATKLPRLRQCRPAPR